MTNTKVYIEIVKQLREMIAADGLVSGDKIPSERELSERLNVGRSSVREALRALELLGLIETRRGEGTFIRDFRGHRLVQLLSTFILQDDKAKKDVLETRDLVEMDCLRLVCQRIGKKDIDELRQWAESVREVEHDQVFNRLLETADNHLLQRMWMILKDYYNSLNHKKTVYKKKEFEALLNAMENRDEAKILALYRENRNLSYS